MEVDSSLNNSMVLRRRSSRRSGTLATNRNSSEPNSLKQEPEQEEDEVGGEEKEVSSEAEEQSSRDSSPVRPKRKKRKLNSLVKRGRMGHYGKKKKKRYAVRTMYEKPLPLRRSKREKRLIFATFNVSKMDKQILQGQNYPDIDISDDEMDPYEKLLSPHRATRSKSGSRLKSDMMAAGTSGSASKIATARAAQGEGEESEEKSESENEKTGEENREEESEEPTEDEDVGGYYNLRKRQPVIYHVQPVHHVVDNTPPKKRRGRRSQSHHSYHSKARSAAPRAYQKRRGGGGKSPHKKQAHHDSSSPSTSSGESDSDEARFLRRKARSMAKSRSQCMPMNFNTDDMTQGIIRDRIRVGASMADISPMNIDRDVNFKSIGGIKQHIKALKEMILFPLLYPEVFEQFQVTPPRGVLFHGPPGCGKTLVARALANECSKGGKKVAFFMRKGADCLSKWVGESERQLRLLFDQAYQVRPAIIFFDEIDGLAPVRSSRQDQIHSSIVSTLLALMDGLDSRGEIVVIGATNRIDSIDPALRRPGRFDREFIFPLPCRDDRHSILSIHTKDWQPRLKNEFLSELSECTVGYCGADLRALCTEAALCALRRRYPQIYNTSDKLVLDPSQITVAASDFHNALRSIVPTAQRSENSLALALPEQVQPLFLHSLNHLLDLLCFTFPPAWKQVDKASSALQTLMAKERDTSDRMELKLNELSISLSLSNSGPMETESCDTIGLGHGGRRIQQSSELTQKSRPKNKTNSVTLSTNHQNHHGNSDTTNSPPYPNMSRWSGSRDPTTTAGSETNHRSHLTGTNNRFRHVSAGRAPSISTNSFTSTLNNAYCKSAGSSSVSTNFSQQMSSSVSLSSAYSQLVLRQSRSTNISEVFFDLSNVCRVEDMASTASQQGSSIHVGGDSGSVSSSHLLSSHYLKFSSHPHATPAVHCPRLVLCGEKAMGQSTYLGPALLHALEDLPMKTLDLSVLFGSSSKTPEEACAQTLRELRRTTPSILYLPRLDSWWDVTSDTLQMTLLSLLSSLPPSTALLVLATAECLWEELPEKLREVFADSASQSFTVVQPSLELRKKFFYEVLLEKPFLPPPPKPVMMTAIPLEELPVASPPKPRELSKVEITRIMNQRESVLRELRVFLRDATNKLLAERKFKEFVKPVDPEEVPDYYDIIAQPMDLSTIMKKIDERRYAVPKEWVADVELIAKNALDYNPEHDSESRLLRHRAVALQDMAHSFLDHELNEEFEEQCEEIVRSYERIVDTEAFRALNLPSTSTPSTTPAKHPTTTTTTTSTLRSELYDAPRRSLRQKGMEPEERGFPYYSPSKPRGQQLGKRRRSEGDLSDYEADVDDTPIRPRAAERAGTGSPAGAEAEECFVDAESEPARLTNTSVRRQIMRPWEDSSNRRETRGASETPRTSSAKQNGIVTPPNERQNRRNSGENSAAEALVAMATPVKDESDGNGAHDVVICNGPTRSRSPANVQVTINGKGVAEVYERVVRGTAGCSVEHMERIHNTYQQLVFRHRMNWQRDGLLEDLRLSTDLFLQELDKHTPPTV